MEGTVTARNFIVSAENLPQFLIDAKQAIEKGDYEKAEELLNDRDVGFIDKTLHEKPRVDIMVMLALMFDRLGQTKKAEVWCKKALEIEQHPFILNKLANICRRTTRPCQAVEYRKRAVAKEPANIEYQVNLAVDLMQLGDIQHGIEILRDAVEKDPSNMSNHSKLLFYLHYLPTIDQQMLFEEHKKWGQIHCSTTLAKSAYDNNPDPERKLRIGYISPDFRMNSAAYNFAAFLTGRNPDTVEVYGYGDVKRPDSFTDYFRQNFDHYRDIVQLTDEDIVQLIERDKIDILVETAGHGTDNRFGVLARKPAPIQVDYGGINTTGMEQIEYRLTDDILDPVHLHKYYVEESIPLSTGLFCYTPPANNLPIEKSPAVENGFVTFGSFNNNLKINTSTISMWAKVLKKNPDSHFIMKFPGANEKQLKDFYLEQFRQFEIMPDRIEFHGWKSPLEHMKLYNKVDIILDTYPFNGCITTLEGLWMGVAVISLAGENSLLSRAGLTILTRLGMEFFAVSSTEEYVKKATALANNLDSLQKIRASMRRRMLSSDLCNAQAYASAVETAYRKMWHKWCRRQDVEIHAKNNQKNTLSQFLISGNDGVKINISKNDVPNFFIQAHKCIQTGQIKEAKAILGDRAFKAVRQIAKRQPSKANAVYFMLATMLKDMGLVEQAEKFYKEILKTETNPWVQNELADICQSAKRVTEAMQYRREALQQLPENITILTRFALDLLRAGEIKKGIELLKEQSEKHRANRTVRSCYLWYQHYLPTQTQQEIFEEHRDWGQAFAPVSRAKTSHNNDIDPDRRLRVGYVSPDFRVNSAAFNFNAFLEGRDPEQVEVFGYGNVAMPDELTEYFKKTFDHYRNTKGVKGEDVVNMITNDKIDILVEIGGHVSGNSLDILSYKPAPIQIDYGGINTSGMEQIDYRLTDAVLDPVRSHKYYIEESVCLPTGLFCYSPADFAPPVAPLPAKKNGFITFGSFNTNIKINPFIMSIWSQVLRANKKSRLILKFAGGDDLVLQNYYFSNFEKFGITRQRVEIHGWKNPLEHFKLYGQIDIALDTYPFNGCITTLEGLWMGVPVVSLAGENSLLSRSGLSILTRLGLEFLAVSTPDEFVEKAMVLAQNVDALEKMRSVLRQRMRTSALCNHKAYACAVESAYRTMWHKWCRQQKVNVSEKI